MIEQDKLASMILWGPPGVGKTTLARIIARKTKSKFIDFSAATSSIKDIKTEMSTAKQGQVFGVRTIVFIDEIHRFNKSQQDAFLPYVESGGITLIGATTENPSFEVNSALLSRCKVFVLHALTIDELVVIGRRAVEKGFTGAEIEASDELLRAMAEFANGDARAMLNTLEMAADNSVDGIVTEDLVQQCLSRKLLLYDKKGEEHYNLISALHKSMRNSDAQAAVYWLARMLEGGEDPLYIARRIVRFASEDIGMADSRALEVCVAAYNACHFLGMPECNVHLTHAAVYCALAKKSNSLESAYLQAKDDALKTIAEPVPLSIRNAPTSLMKDLKYGDGYMYAHDYDEKITTLKCLPDTHIGRKYYDPAGFGEEKQWKERLEEIEEWQRTHRGAGK
jgi:putative ATPase